MRRLLPWACFGVLAACGARSGLSVEAREGDVTAPPETNQQPPKRDSGTPDAAQDAGVDLDAAPPPLDAAPPPPDAVAKSDCDSPETNFIYLVSDNDELYSYYPPSGALRDIGSIRCPSPQDPRIASNSHPFSMAVDRRGVAFVIFADGNMYRVSTKTAACSYSGYNTQGDRLTRFGMGFSSDNGGPEETLFVAGDENLGGANGLAAIDVQRRRQRFISTFPQGVGRMELTGTGDGRLFGFYGRDGQAGTFVGELDKRTARVVGEQAFPRLDFGRGWAFARYAGAFYMFTTPENDSQTFATKFDPETGVSQVVRTFPNTIVGAGVSTCAPDE